MTKSQEIAMLNAEVNALRAELEAPRARYAPFENKQFAIEHAKHIRDTKCVSVKLSHKYVVEWIA